MLLEGQVVQRTDRAPPGDIMTDLQPLGVLIEHRIDDVDERLVTGEEPVPPGQQIAFQPALALVLARQRDRSRPRRGLGAGAAIPPDSRGRAPVPFFNAFRTVVGLMCNTRAVSRMPLAFRAISTICCLTSGDCPA